MGQPNPLIETEVSTMKGIMWPVRWDFRSGGVPVQIFGLDLLLPLSTALTAVSVRGIL